MTPSPVSKASGGANQASWTTLPTELKQRVLFNVIESDILRDAAAMPKNYDPKPRIKLRTTAALLCLDTATSSCMPWALDQAQTFAESELAAAVLASDIIMGRRILKDQNSCRGGTIWEQSQEGIEYRLSAKRVYALRRCCKDLERLMCNAKGQLRRCEKRE